MKYSIDEGINLLERTPILLNILLSGLPADWVLLNEGPDTWGPYDVLGHLIHVKNTDWIVRTEIILSSRKNKRFAPYDRFAQCKNSQGQSVDELLQQLQSLREQNIRRLESFQITEEMLSLVGIHPELGPVTLGNLLAAWVTHDLGHISQIARVLAKQYKAEVGPWPAYIKILND